MSISWATWTKLAPCVAIFLCLLMAPPFLSWLASLASSNQVIWDVRGMEIPALYKSAKRNRDGSIDLTINIPASSHILKRLLDTQEALKHNLSIFHRPRSNHTEPEGNLLPKKKTFYPVTLDTPYVLNSPDICRGVEPLQLLVVVHTAMDNFQRRRLIRETWAARDLILSGTVRLLFVLGLSTDVAMQSLIENEQLVYGDLVQGHFKDSYHNLTHKGVLAYRWIQQYCKHARLILKVDDDMFINPFLLHNIYLPRYTQANRTIVCHVRDKNTSPIQRSKPSKWHVPEYEFRGYESYPIAYCNGYVVLMTPDIVKAMYHAAYGTPFFWVDDVYLYGMLPAKVGRVKHDNIQYQMTLSSIEGLTCYKTLNCTLLAAPAPDEKTLRDLWRLALTQAQKHPVFNNTINPVYLIV